MESVGKLIIGLHRNLEEIRQTLDHGAPTHEGLLLQSTLDRAEAALRKQARDLIASASAAREEGAWRVREPAAWRQLSEGAQPRGIKSATVPPAQSPELVVPTLKTRSQSLNVDVYRPRHRKIAKIVPRKMLPRVNRLDPLAELPPLNEDDLKDGILSLAQRGFIPATADVAPAMECVQPVLFQCPSPMYEQGLKHRRDLRLHDEVISERRRPVRETRLPLSLNGGQTNMQKSRVLPPLPAHTMDPKTSVPSGTSLEDNFGTFCTELLDTCLESPVPRELPAPAPVHALSKAAAVTRIASAWRGFTRRRGFSQLVLLHQTARRIQLAWAAFVLRGRAKRERLRRQEEHRKVHAQMMFELGQDWFQVKQLRRVEVHLCSLSALARRHTRSQALQSAQICRIFRLMDEKRDIIFVAHKHLHDDILDYFAQIMQFRGVRNPPGRLQLVVPELTVGPSGAPLSLSTALLCSPKAMKRIKLLTRNRPAYIVPEAVTQLDLAVSHALKIPLMGPGPRNLELLSSKAHVRSLAVLADVPTGPEGSATSESSFFDLLVRLVSRHSQVRVWVFKIDVERDSRGHAYFDVDNLGASVQATGGSTPGSDSQLRSILERVVPKRAVLCNRHAYPDFSAWMTEASLRGVTVQAVPEGIVAQTSVHLQIDPDGATSVLGTSEAIMCQPFIPALSCLPPRGEHWKVLHEVGLRMGRVLAAKGLVGFASVDVVFFENPDFDASARVPTPGVIGPTDVENSMFAELRSPSPVMSDSASDWMPSLPESRQADYDLAVQLSRHSDPEFSILEGSPTYSAAPLSDLACWLVDVDARLTDAAAALIPLQFISQVSVDATGALLSNGESRCALVAHPAHLPGLDRQSHQQLFQLAKSKGISFDLFNNTGCVFNFLDVFQSLFALLVVDRTHEKCMRRLSAAVTALDGVRGQCKGRSPADREPCEHGRSVTDTQTALRALRRDVRT